MHNNTKKLGRLIGEGDSRIVYEHPYNKNIVIKKRKKKKESILDENYLEWLNYCNFKKYNLQHWLSPCFYSYTDEKLYMQRAEKVIDIPNYNVPTIFSNRRKNWGLLNNKLVSIDYDFLILRNIKKKDINSIKRLYKKSGKLILFENTYNYISACLKKHTNIDINYFSPQIINSKLMLKKMLQNQSKLI